MDGTNTSSLPSADVEARLDALEREDKWFLSCGDGVVWAPPFPQWLDRPGFWDEAMVYYHPFQPLFTVALVDARGNDLPLRLDRSSWRPDRLTRRWRLPTGDLLTETATALPGGTFVSSWLPEGTPRWPAPLAGGYFAAFTAQPGEALSEVHAEATGGIRWRRNLHDRHASRSDAVALLQAGRSPDSITIAAVRSEGTPYPDWRHTPFWEGWNPSGLNTGLSGTVTTEGVSPTGLIYLAVARPVPSTAEPVELSIRLRPPDSPVRVAGPDAKTDPASPWIEFFGAFPCFRCSDPFLTRYFDYRIYGLRLNRLAGDAGNVHYPAVAEGIDYFHVPITYSAQCHMFETRWSRNPELAHGSLLNFIGAQKPDGSFHGRLYQHHLEHTDFYHANWGDAVLAVDRVHGDREFLRRAYDGLAAYARWLDSTRDRERCGMYDVVNHFETGQEFMSRYQAVSPDADREGWRSTLRLKGIDVTVYAYLLKRALAAIAPDVGRERDVGQWQAGADGTGTAIVEQMWDERTGLFSDVDPRTMTRTGVKAAVCFYPLLTDLLDEHRVRCLLEHLQNPQEFGTPFPVPSSSRDDSYFSAEPVWKGKRHNCPWNGRVWPMINSHVVEGLLRQWHAGRRETGPPAAALLARFVRMMFHDGDVNRPNCYEHYNPITGQASIYRGIDDYQHSWVLDLIVRGAAGIEPRSAGVLIDPLPLDVDQLELTGCRVRGREIAVRRSGTTVVATVDGRRYETQVGTPLEIRYQ